MNPIRFAVVGSGWRTLFFLRIARALPDRFEVTGITSRDAVKAKALTAEWGVPVFASPAELLAADKPDFVIVSVAQPAAPDLIATLAETGIPILTETPPAPDMAGLYRLWDIVKGGAHIEVAEQYIYQPLHAARLAIVRSGKLGPVSYANVSVAHGYHGTSLMRHYLDVGFESPVVRAREFTSSIVAGPDRDGAPREHRIETARQVIAELDFGHKLGIFDFVGTQYFSWFRAHRLTLRGEKGEIIDRDIRYVSDFRTPVEMTLRRSDTGQYSNLEGYHHRGIQFGEEWVYLNPYAGAALSDDEIAIATVLEGMGKGIASGKPIYSFADAAQDQYLSLLIDKAVATGAPVKAEPQPWSL